MWKCDDCYLMADQTIIFLSFRVGSQHRVSQHIWLGENPPKSFSRLPTFRPVVPKRPWVFVPKNSRPLLHLSVGNVFFFISNSNPCKVSTRYRRYRQRHFCFYNHELILTAGLGNCVEQGPARRGGHFHPSHELSCFSNTFFVTCQSQSRIIYRLY
jgi:hypothetical protein